MYKFLITLLFLSFPFAVKAGFPEGKDGFNIKKIGIIPDNELTRKLIKGFVWWFLDEFELTNKQLKIIQN